MHGLKDAEIGINFTLCRWIAIEQVSPSHAASEKKLLRDSYLKIESSLILPLHCKRNTHAPAHARFILRPSTRSATSRLAAHRKLILSWTRASVWIVHAAVQHSMDVGELPDRESKVWTGKETTGERCSEVFGREVGYDICLVKCVELGVQEGCFDCRWWGG